jgi:excisionase family DNA binding protein
MKADLPYERLAYRVGEFAEAIGVSRSKAYELVASGEVPSIRIGSSRRVPVTALREWIDRQVSANREASK